MSPRYEELIFGDIDLNSDAVFDEVMKYAMMPSTPQPADYDYSTHGRSFTQPLPQNVGGSNDTFGYMSMECSHSLFANEVATTHQTTATLAQTARTPYSFGTSTISEPFIPDTVNPRLQQLEPAVGLEPTLSIPQHSQSLPRTPELEQKLVAVGVQPQPPS
ncbi:hypothetical protein VNI00_017971 [Paramarasmius palmivorus]|uniref:Uncharacterized protein n=1 Tax=Paramarasmius palmivorus TaxID=297713 RepID=A0AAW0B2B3_9AGAR